MDLGRYVTSTEEREGLESERLQKMEKWSENRCSGAGSERMMLSAERVIIRSRM